MAKAPAHAAHEKHHDFHLVDPSPWPILASFALLITAVGAVMFFHKVAYGAWVLKGGLVAVTAIAFFWWRDAIKEAIVDKAHTMVVRKGLRVGMGLFITSEVMFFVAFFWAFFWAALHAFTPLTGTWPVTTPGVWPPTNITTLDAWDLPLINTLILLLSGTTVTWAHHALLHNDRKGLIQGLAITVALGLIFTALQAVEYGHATFTFKDGVYPSAFYMATGFHGAHVIIGTIFLAVCLFRAMKGHFTPDQHLGFEFAAWYWHFVDVVWLFLFVSIYWWGS